MIERKTNQELIDALREASAWCADSSADDHQDACKAYECAKGAILKAFERLESERDQAQRALKVSCRAMSVFLDAQDIENFGDEVHKDCAVQTMLDYWDVLKQEDKDATLGRLLRLSLVGAKWVRFFTCKHNTQLNPAVAVFDCDEQKNDPQISEGLRLALMSAQGE